MTENKIKKFIEKFFETLGCKITENKGILKIENVPAKFSKFYGKEEPYYFYFNKSDKIQEGEYVTKGSYLLSCINKFLENKGETTLLKIKFEEKPKKIIQERFKIRNCSISEVNPKPEYKHLERFTFLTTFQYLNKKEEVITKIFIKQGEEKDFDLSKYELEEGKKRDIKTINFKEDYETARKRLKEKIREKTNSLKEKITENLEKEKTRIHEHYKEQIKDDEKNIEKLKKQLEGIEQKEENIKRAERINEQIRELNSEKRVSSLEKEKEASIKQEIQKHTLDIKNKLLNTTIIYYPFYKYEVYFKTSNNSKRLVYFYYDSLEDKFLEIKCDCCKKEIGEIILCSSGHLICRDCGDRCERCNDIICKKCYVLKCTQCGKKICRNCSKRCSVCGKIKCSNHLIKESFEGKEICKDCSKNCPECGELYNSKNMKKTKTGKEICEKCFQKEVKKKVLKSLNK